jgi:hypothetical protein
MGIRLYGKGVFTLFITNVITVFFVAFGIVAGGSMMRGLAAFLINEPPFTKMLEHADQLKIWGLVGALGGTFDSFMQIEKVFVEGHLPSFVKQGILILSAFAGAHSGSEFIHWLIGADRP